MQAPPITLSPTRLDVHRRGCVTVHFRAHVNGKQRFLLPVPAAPPFRHDLRDLQNLFHLRVGDTRGGSQPTVFVDKSERISARAPLQVPLRVTDLMSTPRPVTYEYRDGHAVLPFHTRPAVEQGAPAADRAFLVLVQTHGKGDGVLTASYVVSRLRQPLYDVFYTLDAGVIRPADAAPLTAPVPSVAYSSVRFVNPLPFPLRNATVHFIDGGLRYNSILHYQPSVRTPRNRGRGDRISRACCDSPGSVEHSEMSAAQSDSYAGAHSSSDGDEINYSSPDSAMCAPRSDRLSHVDSAGESDKFFDSETFKVKFLTWLPRTLAHCERLPPLDICLDAAVSLQPGELLIAGLQAQAVELSFMHAAVFVPGYSTDVAARVLQLRNTSNTPIEEGFWSISCGTTERVSQAETHVVPVGRVTLLRLAAESAVEASVVKRVCRRCVHVDRVEGFNLVVQTRHERVVEMALRNCETCAVEVLLLVERGKKEPALELVTGGSDSEGENKTASCVSDPSKGLVDDAARLVASERFLSEEVKLFTVALDACKFVRVVARYPLEAEKTHDVRQGVPADVLSRMVCAEGVAACHGRDEVDVVEAVNGVERARLEAEDARAFRDALATQAVRAAARSAKRVVVLDMSDDEDGEACDRFEAEMARRESRVSRVRGMVVRAERRVAHAELAFHDAVEELHDILQARAEKSS